MTKQGRAYRDKTIRLKACCPPRVSETFRHLAEHDKPGRLLPRFSQCVPNSAYNQSHTQAPSVELTHVTETDTCSLQVQYCLEPNLEAGQLTGVCRAVNWLTLGSLILFAAIYLFDDLKSYCPISPSITRGDISHTLKEPFLG